MLEEINLKEQIKEPPIQEKPEENLTLENQEAKNEVKEKFREGRLDILKNKFSTMKDAINKKVPQSLQNLISTGLDKTIISGPKMAVEAYVGKTVSGEELTPTDRVLYGLIAGANMASYALTGYAASTGDTDYLKTAGILYAGHWALFGVQRIPKIIRDLANLAEKYKFIETKNTLNKINDMIKKYGISNQLGKALEANKV